MILDKKIPLQERLNFAVYALSRFILSVGSNVYLFAVSYYILYETGSAFYFSINMAISVLVTVALLPFSGLLSDMKNKRRIIISGESLNTLVILGLFIYTVFYDINLIAIYMVTFLNSLIEPFVSNAFQAAITELFHKDRVQKVMGYTSALLSVSIILGPILGGVLFGLLSFNHIILIFFIGFFISTILDFLLKFDLCYQRYLYKAQGEVEKGGVKFRQNINEGFRFIFKSDVFKSLLIIAALANFMTGIISIFPEKMMIVELGFEPEAVGIVNAAAGIGVLIGGVIVGKSKQFENPFLLMKRGFLVYAALCLLYLLPLYLGLNTISNIIFIGLAGIGFTLTLQFINVPLNVFLQFVTPQHIKGRVFSTVSLFAGSITPLGAIIFGYLYDFGLYWPVNLGSALMMIMIVYIFYSNRLIDASKKMYKRAKMDAADNASDNHPDTKRERKSPETEPQEM
ncbi:MFS transporter [Salinicoccus albus]|uniref:MFS transporter n=1 Tax=Salinicoccus albus TaxID=418756 RepID=UPI00036266BD|nr:MFS transporter [Salinicoccus albus]